MRLTHWFRNVAFLLSGYPEQSWVEQRLRAQVAEDPGSRPEPVGDLPLAVAVPFEFQSVVAPTGAWPHWPVVWTAV